MENRIDFTPEGSADRAANGRFLPGQSGNPLGRPRKTTEEDQALREIRDLAPGVAAKMKEMLDAPRVPAVAKVRILEIILERTYGKPETAIKLSTAQQSVEAAQSRLEAIFARVRVEGETAPAAAGGAAGSAVPADSAAPAVPAASAGAPAPSLSGEEAHQDE